MRRTYLSDLWERLHEFNPLSVDLDEGQQVPGLDRLKQLDHLSGRGRARLPRIPVVHILGVDELLPHGPVEGGGGNWWDFQPIGLSGSFSSSESTYMSLDGVGFGVGEVRFPSMISLKLLFPTFLASWWRKERRSALDHHSRTVLVCLQRQFRTCSFRDQILLSAAFPLLSHYF